MDWQEAGLKEFCRGRALVVDETREAHVIAVIKHFSILARRHSEHGLCRRIGRLAQHRPLFAARSCAVTGWLQLAGTVTRESRLLGD